MTGVVLCGGQSLRMGADKGLLKFDDQAIWAQHVYEILAALKMPVAVSVNNHQAKRYACFFDAQQLVYDNNKLTMGGPLKGILSVHVKYPDEDLLILACDMIHMQQEPLLHLIQSVNTREEAFVFCNDTHAEPLCAVYTSKALHKLYTLYANNHLHKQSMHYALQQLEVLYTDVLPEWKSFFNNYNCREDLDGK
jgi:molybdopterin-guanine dinucleotide biosynthesis protein A